MENSLDAWSGVETPGREKEKPEYPGATGGDGTEAKAEAKAKFQGKTGVEQQDREGDYTPSARINHCVQPGCVPFAAL